MSGNLSLTAADNYDENEDKDLDPEDLGKYRFFQLNQVKRTSTLVQKIYFLFLLTFLQTI